MKNFRTVWYSLNGRLTICLIVSIFGMGAILLHGFYNSWNDARNEAYEEFHITGSKMQTELTAMFDSYKVMANIVGYSTSVQRYLLATDPESVIRSSSPAMNYLDNVLQLSGDCLNVFLYSHNGRHLYANSSHTDIFQAILERRGFDRDVTISRPFFVPVSDTADSSYVFYFTPVYNLLTPSSSNQIIVSILCDMTSILQRISVFDENSPDAMALMYSGKVLSSSRSLTDSERRLLSEIPENQGDAVMDSTKYLTTRISVPGEHWDFIYFIPEQTILIQALNAALPPLVPLCLLFLGVSLFLILLLRSVNRCTAQIVEDINSLTYENRRGSSSRIRNPRLAELQTVSQSANDMLERLDEAFRREQMIQKQLYEAIHAQNQAEMASYRSQINPHFLFNTLECIRSLAHSSGEQMIETMISSMALMFRYSLYSATMVPFSQEISHVENYMNVMSIRFPGRYSLRCSVRPGAADHMVLSMILQPVVENTVKHAFADRDTLCKISVRAFLNERGFLVIRVADNGCGLTDAGLADLERRMRLPEENLRQEKSSIGLQNIFRRMKLTFGNSFHIRFYSRHGHYTVVELIIPRLPTLPPFETR